jgi:hypothetical protein
MRKLSAEELCCYLNELAVKDPDFIQEVLLHKVYCNESIANSSDVVCGEAGYGYKSSALGLLNALVDKKICLEGNGLLYVYTESEK